MPNSLPTSKERKTRLNLLKYVELKGTARLSKDSRELKRSERDSDRL